jgi:glycosyltransferase involved in cell wall biosynthesis
MATSYCFLSTYPPAQCGVASFTAALVSSLTTANPDDRVSVVRVITEKVYTARPEVVAHMRVGTDDGILAAVTALNQHDVAVVQHEYGIFGGIDGDDVLAVLEQVRVPVIVVLHTVMTEPTPHQRAVLEQVAGRADAIVTMTETARTRLLSGYHVDSAKVSVIPHGAVEHEAPRLFDPSRRATILTWGLLGPGKGIEWGLIGLREIRRLHPQPRYVIAGDTHPLVRQQQGEAYRLSLGTRARALGVSDLVRFERGYLEEPALARLIDRADVVLLPYDSREQITSGVLVEAIAAHKPVVSTAFPHAVELLSAGAGLLVPQRDGVAIGAALRRVLTEPHLANRMSTAAGRIAPELRWPTVAQKYRSLADDLLRAGSTVTG